MCNTEIFRALGKGKAEREGEHSSWKCAATAGRGKQQSLETGKQKGRQQKSVEDKMIQRRQRGLVSHWS